MRVLSIETEYEEYYWWGDNPTTLRTANVRYIVDVEHVVGGHLFKSEVEVPESEYGNRRVSVEGMEDYLRGLLKEEAEIGVIKKEEQHTEEQLYKVIIPDPEKKAQARVNGLMRTEDNRINIGNINKEAFRTNRENVCLTEEEIKRNHSYLWQFAEPVEELKYIIPLKGLLREGRKVYLANETTLLSDPSNNFDWSASNFVKDNIKKYSFTEEEIKAINSDFWKYAIPIDKWLEGANR